MYGYSLGYKWTQGDFFQQGSNVNQIPVGALTNKAGTKYIVTVSGKYLTIKT